MPRMFGTDGVRGLANRDLTAQLALDLGDAAVRVLGDDERSEFESRRRALVGRDTRVSGDFLAAALSAGMSAGGFDVIDAGIIPTPGVAYLTSVLNVEMGAVISASHNPMPDNGIKFFARGGFKLPDTKEDEIEAVLGQDWDRPTGAGVGRVSHDTATATNLYIDHLVSVILALKTGIHRLRPGFIFPRIVRGKLFVYRLNAGNLDFLVIHHTGNLGPPFIDRGSEYAQYENNGHCPAEQQPALP